MKSQRDNEAKICYDTGNHLEGAKDHVRCYHYGIDKQDEFKEHTYFRFSPIVKVCRHKLHIRILFQYVSLHKYSTTMSTIFCAIVIFAMAFITFFHKYYSLKRNALDCSY